MMTLDEIGVGMKRVELINPRTGAWHPTKVLKVIGRGFLVGHIRVRTTYPSGKTVETVEAPCCLRRKPDELRKVPE